MAPIKFEENIKDKLEKRTLSPSSQSWSKLNKRLETDEKQSKNSMFWWLSIAAGLLIMIAVSVQFFNADESESVMPQIVKEKDLEEQLNNKNQKIDDKKSIDLVIHEDRVEENRENKEEDFPIRNEPQIIKDKKVHVNKSDKPIKLAELKDLKENEKLQKLDKEIKNLPDVIDDALIKEALDVAMQELKNERSGISDREIDSLLKLASKELFKEKLNLESTKTVDANMLLQSVEDEMGQSYRGKVFEALKESYKTVKTAVVNRNN